MDKKIYKIIFPRFIGMEAAQNRQGRPGNREQVKEGRQKHQYRTPGCCIECSIRGFRYFRFEKPSFGGGASRAPEQPPWHRRFS